ncbi:MAG: hypothetical protein LQ340_008009 [Diploschistes diacapsis]|nr:MAG: hypothetical protein LQ340_008009 [Diploschistes diacapsis]
METAASRICAEPYSDEAIPATWPRRFIQPTTQLIEGTQGRGARREMALTSSATLHAMHIHPAPEMSQHQTAEAAPPPTSGKEKVVTTVLNNPEMETAKEKDER